MLSVCDGLTNAKHMEYSIKSVLYAGHGIEMPSMTDCSLRCNNEMGCVWVHVTGSALE